MTCLILPVNQLSWIIPVSKTILKSLQYIDINLGCEYLKYSFAKLSIPAALPFFRFFIAFIISLSLIDPF